MAKWRLMVALILVIGVVGALFLCNSALFSGWMLMHPHEQDRHSWWNAWAWIMLGASCVSLVGSWTLAWWVWKIGSRRRCQSE